MSKKKKHTEAFDCPQCGQDMRLPPDNRALAVTEAPMPPVTIEDRVIEKALAWYRQRTNERHWLSELCEAGLWQQFLEALHTLYCERR